MFIYLLTRLPSTPILRKETQARDSGGRTGESMNTQDQRTREIRAQAKLGSDHSAMRARNERLVLTLIRRRGALPKSEIARVTGLSAQTVSVIMRELEADGLLVKCAPVRGKVGQPSVPMDLAADGALFFGLKVGRRRTEMVLIDFAGEVRARAAVRHDHPTPDATRRFAQDTITTMSATLTATERDRICGLGIGLPFQLWDWAEALRVPEDTMRPWRSRDIRSELAATLPWPVLMENDASAACNAELIFGDGTLPQNFLYAFVGFFIGGGLVLNGTMFAGAHGNAGALASMPVPDGQGGSRQLVEVASLHHLEERLRATGGDGRFLWESVEGWDIAPEIIDPWIAEAARGLAHVTASAVALCDLDALVVDGWLPTPLRDRLCIETAAELARINLSGIAPPEIIAGQAGPEAREFGAASLPLSARFLLELGSLPNDTPHPGEA
jgi:predicted NBD/HSP70 family sugar kinase